MVVQLWVEEIQSEVEQMAKAKVEVKKIKSTPKKTSVGKSRRSRPLNKSKRRNWKRYRGQGR